MDTEKAKEILNTILEKQDNAYAYYHLGRILLDEFDKQVLTTSTKPLKGTMVLQLKALT